MSNVRKSAVNFKYTGQQGENIDFNSIINYFNLPLKGVIIHYNRISRYFGYLDLSKDYYICNKEELNFNSNNKVVSLKSLQLPSNYTTDSLIRAIIYLPDFSINTVNLSVEV